MIEQKYAILIKRAWQSFIHLPEVPDFLMYYILHSKA